MSVILITGASTGIGNLTAKALAADGHTVYASMRDAAGRNAAHAQELLDLAQRDEVELRVIDLDVQSQASADQAIASILEDAGQLEVVIHNAGHLYVGYVEAFTAEDVARLFDINVLGAQRVNRAALPHMRKRRAGTLLYVGSTTTVSVPPFLGPYVASKFAFDAIAMTTSYEVSQFGIETTIVMPGAFTQGTEHFPNASHTNDQAITAAYSALDPLVERNEEATASLSDPAVDADPAAVATEISRILSLPIGEKPFRSVVDFTQSHVDRVVAVTEQSRRDFLTRMGFGELLELKTQEPMGA
jgi:NAD(P)-dependent dehydrogenase (short-subunit alcohol dehydrogenase family)